MQVAPTINAQEENPTPAVIHVPPGLPSAQAVDVSTKAQQETQTVAIQSEDTQNTAESLKVDHAPEDVPIRTTASPATGKEATTISKSHSIDPTSKEVSETSLMLQEAANSPKITVDTQEGVQVTPPHVEPAQLSTITNDIPMHANLSSSTATPMQLDDTTMSPDVARAALTSTSQAEKESEAWADALTQVSMEAAQQTQDGPAQLAQSEQDQEVQQEHPRAPNLLDRLDGGVELINEDNQDNARSQTGKRKRGTTPLMPTTEEPLSNRPKNSESTYAKFAKQRRSPTPVNPGKEDFKSAGAGDKLVNDRRGRKSVDQDEKLPAECTRDLACVFVGNIPASAKDADIRPWLFSKRNLPRPVLITKLATARGTTNGPQYLRVFFKLSFEAEKAVDLLKKIPFETPPAQLVIRILDKKLGKITLYWRDVEKWARSYLEDLALSRSTPSSNESEQKTKAIPRTEKSQAEPSRDQLPVRPRQAKPTPARPTSQDSFPPEAVSQEANRLADRVATDYSRRHDRYEDQNRRSISDRTSNSSLSGRDRHWETDDRDHENSLASRVREPATYSGRLQDRSSYQSDRRQEDKYNLAERLDESLPRKRSDYAPPREGREARLQDDRSDLLGRMNR